ncbi:MAG: hypothetical protein WBM09_04525 [Gallionella sp.]
MARSPIGMNGERIMPEKKQPDKPGYIQANWLVFDDKCLYWHALQEKVTVCPNKYCLLSDNSKRNPIEGANGGKKRSGKAGTVAG